MISLHGNLAGGEVRMSKWELEEVAGHSLVSRIYSQDKRLM